MQITAADDKKKRGDGINSVLKLMSDARDFQLKIDDCIEEQSNPEYKTKIEEFNKYMDKMYAVLLDIAKTGIESVRQDRIARQPIPVKEQPDVVRVNAPEVPIMPK